jgi:hypothetical protein
MLMVFLCARHIRQEVAMPVQKDRDVANPEGYAGDQSELTIAP